MNPAEERFLRVVIRPGPSPSGRKPRWAPKGRPDALSGSPRVGAPVCAILLGLLAFVDRVEENMSSVSMYRLKSSGHFWKVVSLVVLVGFVSFLAPSEAAAAKAKSIKTEAFFVSLDPETNVLEVKVKKTGKRPKNKKLKLKTGKPASFNVKPEGSVLKRTTVALDGQRVDIGEIEPNQFLFIYWVPDEKNPAIPSIQKSSLRRGSSGPDWHCFKTFSRS